MLNYVSMITEFIEFIQEEMKKRGWSQADLARQTGMTTGGVSMLLNQTRKPSPETLITLAGVFQLPPERLFREAGFLPQVPENVTGKEELNYLLKELSDEGKEDLLTYARFLLAKEKKFA